MEKPVSMRQNVDRIKQTLRWFPGVVLGLGRQVGKTSALLEVIHDDFNGDATVFSPNIRMSDYAKNKYMEKYPNERVPEFSSHERAIRGKMNPVFADEWWFITPEERRDLIATGRLVARIGTEFGQRHLESTVIRFTDEELDLLESLFLAFATGRVTYCIKGVPENKQLNRDLHRKFKSAKEDV